MKKTSKQKQIKKQLQQKLSPEARRWMVDKLARGEMAGDVVIELEAEFQIRWKKQAVWDFGHRNKEHVEARQAELSKELWRYPIAHAFFQLENVERIFKEARGESNHQMQLACIEQANRVMDRLAMALPGEYGSKKEAEAFLASIGCGQVNSGAVQGDE